MAQPVAQGRISRESKNYFDLAVGAFVGALAGGAMADNLGESPQSGQVLLASVTEEFVPEGNFAAPTGRQAIR